jgi:hypothetical protein
VNWNPNRYPLAPVSHRYQIRRLLEEKESEERRSAATQAPSQIEPDSALDQISASGTDRVGGAADSAVTPGRQSSASNRRARWANWNPNACCPDQTSDP